KRGGRQAGGDGRGAIVPEGGSGGADHRGDRRADRGRGTVRRGTTRHDTVRRGTVRRGAVRRGATRYGTARRGERGRGRQQRSSGGAVVRRTEGAQCSYDVAVHSGGDGFGEAGQAGVGLGGMRRVRRKGEDLAGAGHESSMIRSEVSGAPGSRSTAARVRS